MPELFHIVNENPNDQIGGGGCVCGDSKQIDCNGPFAVFYATETDSCASPHVVICSDCLISACASIDGEVFQPTTDRIAAK